VGDECWLVKSEFQYKKLKKYMYYNKGMADKDKIITNLFDAWLKSCTKVDKDLGPAISFLVENSAIKNNDILLVNNEEFYVICHEDKLINIVSNGKELSEEEFVRYISDKYNIKPTNILYYVKLEEKYLSDIYDNIYRDYFGKIVKLCITENDIHSISPTYDGMKLKIRLISSQDSSEFYEFLNKKYPDFFEYVKREDYRKDAVEEIAYGSTMVQTLDNHDSGKVGVFVTANGGHHYIITSGHSYDSMFSRGVEALSRDPPGTVKPFKNLMTEHNPVDIGIARVTSAFTKCVLADVDCKKLREEFGISYGPDRNDRASYRPIIVTESLLLRYVKSMQISGKPIEVYRYIRDGDHAVGYLKEIAADRYDVSDVVVEWSGTPFASRGDSGSLYYIKIEGKIVPIAIHRASVQNTGPSYGTLLSAGLQMIEKLTDKRFYMCSH
jgi:hypothetical protein